ncbi:hypothetical protein vseg_005465 [Gypsophila vaccaria]
MHSSGDKANRRDVRKGSWSDDEDKLLRDCIAMHGEGSWHRVPLMAGLNRCRKSCRLRWMNYLKPNIKRGQFKEDEVDLIIRLHKLLGNRWSLIAGRIPGRTANDVKNYYNTHLLKKTRPQSPQKQANNVCSGSNMMNFKESDYDPKQNESAHTTAKIVRPKPWRFRKSSNKTASATGGPVRGEPKEEQAKDADDCENGKWWERLVQTYNNNNNNINEQEELSDEYFFNSSTLSSINQLGFNYNVWPTSSIDEHNNISCDDYHNPWNNVDAHLWN